MRARPKPLAAPTSGRRLVRPEEREWTLSPGLTSKQKREEARAFWVWHQQRAWAETSRPLFVIGHEGEIAALVCLRYSRLVRRPHRNGRCRTAAQLSLQP